MIDLGCGAGNYSISLAERGFRVTGIDISEEMISRAINRVTEGDVKFLVGDMREFKIGERYDCAIYMGTFNHLTTNEDIRRSLRSAADHLVDGGYLYIHTFCQVGALAQGTFKHTYVPRSTEGMTVIFHTFDIAKSILHGEEHHFFRDGDGLLQGRRRVRTPHPPGEHLLPRGIGFRTGRINRGQQLRELGLL